MMSSGNDAVLAATPIINLNSGAVGGRARQASVQDSAARRRLWQVAAGSPCHHFGRRRRGRAGDERRGRSRNATGRCRDSDKRPALSSTDPRPSRAASRRPRRQRLASAGIYAGYRRPHPRSHRGPLSLPPDRDRRLRADDGRDDDPGLFDDPVSSARRGACSSKTSARRPIPGSEPTRSSSTRIPSRTTRRSTRF